MNDREKIEEFRKPIDELLYNFHKLYPYEMTLQDRDLCIEAMGYLRACRMIALCEPNFMNIDTLYSDLALMLVNHDIAKL